MASAGQMPALGTRWREVTTGQEGIVTGERTGHVLLHTDINTEASIEVRFFFTFWRRCG